jgi:trans-aconitate methyltransferase
MLWNFEYRHGRWSHLDGYDNSELIKLIEQSHSGGTMLDLGCGTAANFTPPPAFSYLGVDISREAIRTADRRRRPNASYRIADISEYIPTGTYDVILMREVLHYLPLPVVRRVLDRMTDALTPDGIAVIHIRSTDIHRPVLDAVLQSRLVVAERHDRADGNCTLIMSRAAALSGGVTVQPG